MNLSPAYLQRREEILQEGVRQGQRVIIENLLKVRFGSLDEQLSKLVEPLLDLSPEESTRLLTQLSRVRSCWQDLSNDDGATTNKKVRSGAYNSSAAPTSG
ncbi:MAG: hypothetical protein JOZ78_16015 [Chroococcidiopsidaceae cyanobacterium CP_BM_ER_R8_30]|nr:hypothetical protein [Chroococcidiopsidaceae cyanobacterium CP_BM_ER_R8_30]